MDRTVRVWSMDANEELQRRILSIKNYQKQQSTMEPVIIGECQAVAGDLHMNYVDSGQFI